MNSESHLWDLETGDELRDELTPSDPAQDHLPFTTLISQALAVADEKQGIYFAWPITSLY